MTWIEVLIIAVGISLDLFAAMEAQGSLVSKINKWHLSGICVLIAVWQLVSLGLGVFLSGLMYKLNQVPNETSIGEILAIVIYAGLGIRLVLKAIRDEQGEEHLELHLGLRRFVRVAAVTSIYTLLAGIAFGLLETNMVMVLTMIVAITVIVVIAGMYTGYHVGHMHRKKAYIAGTVIMWIAGIDVLIRCIMAQAL